MHIRIVAAAMLALSIASTVGPNASGQAPDVDRCLSETTPPRVVESCPHVDADIEIAVAPADLVIKLTNNSDSDWPGPIAAEIPVSASRGIPVGDLTDRGGQMISRCEFETPLGSAIAAKKSVSCALPRAAITQGAKTLWITGFRDRIPRADGVWGTKPAQAGVIPVASPRSIEFKLTADTAEINDASSTDANPPVQVIASPTTSENEASISPGPVIAIGALLAAIGGLAVLRRRRMTAGTPGSKGSQR